MAPGVDTIRVGGRVVRSDNTSPGWLLTGSVDEAGRVGWKGQRRQLRPGVWLSIVPGHDGLTGWVEGSAPKSLNGVNYPAVSPEEAADAAQGWWEEAADFVEWQESARVNRLDLVADLAVGPGRVEEVLQTVGGFVAGGRAVRAIYRDPSSNRALTVWARTKRSGSGRLYDKRSESGVEAAAGIVRFEAQETRLALRRSHIDGLEGVRRGAGLDEALRARWDWCGFGARVVGHDDLVEGILGQGWRMDTKLKLIGWVSMGTPRMERRETEWRYRKRLLEVGQRGHGASGWRLDLDVGGLVAA